MNTSNGTFGSHSNASSNAAVSTHSTPRKRYAFVDLLNIIACIAVVGLHVSSTVFSPAQDAEWTTDIAFQAAFIFAVPVFFMISGMNLLGYRERYTTREFIVKRVKRVGVALLVGSLVFYLAFCLLPQYFSGAEGFAEGFGLKDFVKRFFTNGINNVYWFLYEIIYLYLLTPLLSLALPRKRLMEYLIVLTALCSIGLPLLQNAGGVDATYFSPIFSWPLFASRSLMYFLIGGYIGKYVKISTSWQTTFIAAVVYAAATIAMMLWGLDANGYFEGVRPETYNNYPAGTASPLCIVQTLAVFTFCRSLEPALRKLPRVARSFLIWLSRASLTVYLIHMFFIDLQPVGALEGFVNAIGSSKVVELICVYALSAAIGVVLQVITRSLKSHRRMRGN